MKVINGEGLLLGRMCSFIAKAALLGEEIKVVNCDKIVISGDRKKIFAHEKERRDRKGYPLKSAKFSKLPDRYVRRVIRGMLPYKQGRGKEAFGRILCYVGVPGEFSGKEESIEKAKADKLPTLKSVTVGELCNWLKGTCSEKKPFSGMLQTQGFETK